jgi:hypothetical protein
MAGREPPFRYWAANLTKRLSHHEALSGACTISATFLFLRLLRLFAAIPSVFTFAPLRHARIATRSVAGWVCA